MNKKIVTGFSVAIGLILLLLIVPNYFSSSTNSSVDHYMNTSLEKIEIYHFHGTAQCISCITVGDYAEETLNTYFQGELNSGKIVFGHINYELPENQEKVARYGVTGPSLWMGVYGRDGSFSKEENFKVWYKIESKQDYMSYLKGVIEEKLSGKTK